MGEHNEEVTRLEDQIESLENLRRVLYDDVIEAKLSELKVQLDQLIHTLGGAYSAHHIGGNLFNQGDSSGCARSEQQCLGVESHTRQDFSVLRRRWAEHAGNEWRPRGSGWLLVRSS
jgi:hypothetical protein